MNGRETVTAARAVKRARQAAALLLAVFPLLARPQPAAGLEGVWTGTLGLNDGGSLAVRVMIGQTDGVWHFIPRDNQARWNPCLGKNFPITITLKTDSELAFEIRGASVVSGCINEAAHLTLTQANALEGSLQGGRVVKLSR